MLPGRYDFVLLFNPRIFLEDRFEEEDIIFFYTHIEYALYFSIHTLRFPTIYYSTIKSDHYSRRTEHLKFYKIIDIKNLGTL